MNRPNCHKSSFEAGVVSLARDAARARGSHSSTSGFNGK